MRVEQSSRTNYILISHILRLVRFDRIRVSMDKVLRGETSAPPLSHKEMEKNVTIKIDQAILMMTFAADADFHHSLAGQTTYLDKISGAIVFVTDNPETVAMEIGAVAANELATNSKLVQRSPDQYVKIPSMTHREHHQVLQDFLDSSWTDDIKKHTDAVVKYGMRRSIGHWLANVDDELAVQEYYNFKTEENIRLAEQFLRQHGLANFKWV